MLRRALVVVAVFAAGCGPHPELVSGFGEQGMIARHRERHHESEPAIVYDAAPGFPYSPAAAPPDANIPPPAPARAAAIGMDSGRTRRAIDDVDLGACRDTGAPRGYGHARLTFDEAGYVTKVVIDAPAGLEPDAVSCIGHTLGRAQTSPFTGPDLTVETTWFVP